MKGIKKRLLGLLLTAVFFFISSSSTAFAAEIKETTNTNCYNIEVTSEGIMSMTDQNGTIIEPNSARSSVSGSGEATLVSGNDGIQVFVNTSGWGGMGVTINASSSWNGYMSMNMFSSEGRTLLTGRSVYSNGETYFNNLKHYNPQYYLFTFKGIPSGKSVYIRIWIYG